MAYLINLDHHKDERGTLTVIDKVLPFDIKRTYYITNVNHLDRGGHRHFKLVEGVLCLSGSFNIWIDNGETTSEFLLDNPHQCLVIEPGEWHRFYNFTDGAVLFSLASTHYDPEDYVYEPYSR
jgi:dTDP-4-dehydrorhamnose 3,5-epimerase-like enzyme